MYLNFADIPGYRNLFLDYVYEFENVQKFYGNNFREISKYPETFKQLSTVERPHRKKLYEIIKSQYKFHKPSKLTQTNIEALQSEKTIAVVTGQQLGLFGGPLYTFYKAFTTIKLAANLKEIFDDYTFVPIFWMESDDHDFQEVRTTKIIDKNNNLKVIEYDDNLPTEINRGSVGNIIFNENINACINELRTNLRKTEFSENLFSVISSAYAEGKSFKDSFGELFFKLFDELGLIIFNPQDLQVKALLQPIFKNELLNYTKHTTTIIERSAELEELYHAQVKVKPVNLFLTEDGGRYSIEPVANYFRLKGKRKKYSLDELLNILDTQPGRFSPNVLLRPICQDYLLPTGIYVAGPSEINYFAQVIPLYNHFNIPEPIIYPRASATIIEKNSATIIAKYNLSIEDFFIDNNTLLNKVVESLSEINIEELFENSKNQIEFVFDEIKEKLFAIDKTLLNSTSKTQQKISHLLEILKSKAKEAEIMQHKIIIRQIENTQNYLFPNKTLQEREINFIYFANKYGLDLFKWIFNELNINKFEHQIIEL